jgi:hypothetical protein
MVKLLQGRDQKAVTQLLQMLHKPEKDSIYVKYMPPLVGTEDEIRDLSIYLATLSRPQGEMQGAVAKK